eukprot:1180890-Prorocentrum_minimum.AAC.2
MTWSYLVGSRASSLLQRSHLREKSVRYRSAHRSNCSSAHPLVAPTPAPAAARAHVGQIRSHLVTFGHIWSRSVRPSLRRPPPRSAPRLRTHGELNHA